MGMLCQKYWAVELEATWAWWAALWESQAVRGWPVKGMGGALVHIRWPSGPYPSERETVLSNRRREGFRNGNALCFITTVLYSQDSESRCWGVGIYVCCVKAIYLSAYLVWQSCVSVSVAYMIIKTNAYQEEKETVRGAVFQQNFYTIALQLGNVFFSTSL